MAETTYFPRRLILAGAMMTGVLLALAVHMLGARYGLDLGGLWRADSSDLMPAGAAIAWWLIATVGFSGGYFTANLMHSAVSGQIPQRMRQFLIGDRRADPGRRRPGGLGAEPVADGLRRARRHCGAGARRRDRLLRRAFRAPQGLAANAVRRPRAHAPFASICVDIGGGTRLAEQIALRLRAALLRAAARAARRSRRPRRW